MSNIKRDQSQNEWDVIVIGSGIGGMAAAAALSRLEHKVLLLEQHHKLGGLTHSFSREGFSWDVGIHYMSLVAPGETVRHILDWLCDTPIEFASMGSVYDILHIGDSEPLLLTRPYEAQILDLKERFPEESKAIDDWYDAIHKGRDIAMSIVQSHAIPRPLDAFMDWWKRDDMQRLAGQTIEEVAAEITDNPQLKAALFAQWGDHGGRPSKASFAAHALIACSYLESGAWYPIGGSSVIAERILPVIGQAGGEARAGVTVDSVLFEDGRAVGVRTAQGEEIRARYVISNIGAYETVDKLLPENLGVDDWINTIRSFTPSICHFSLHLGFEGDVEKAGATKANHWIYPTGETDVIWKDVTNSKPPGIIATFASLKDPNHDPGIKHKQSGELIVWTDWSVVEQWAGTTSAERGEDYAAFKKKVSEQMFSLFEAYFPELAKLVVYRDLSTPLSTASITGHRKGAFYGLDVTPERMLSDALRMKTPLKGFYLAGQDVASPGIPGALWGGVLCAGCIDYNVFKHFRLW